MAGQASGLAINTLFANPEKEGQSNEKKTKKKTKHQNKMTQIKKSFPQLQTRTQVGAPLTNGKHHKRLWLTSMNCSSGQGTSLNKFRRRVSCSIWRSSNETNRKEVSVFSVDKQRKSLKLQKTCSPDHSPACV